MVKTTRDEGRGDDSTLADAHEIVSALYAKQFIPTLGLCVGVAALASVPYTQWKMPPTADMMMSNVIWILMGISYGGHCALLWAISPKPAKREFAWSAFQYNGVAYLFLCGGINTILSALQVPYTFYYMQWLIFGINMLSGDTILRSLLNRMFLAKVGDSSRVPNKQMSKKERKKKKKKKTNISVTITNAIMQISALLCPVFLVPIFRSHGTTDSSRLVVACILLPSLLEFNLTMMRSGSAATASGAKIDNQKIAAIHRLATPYLLEFYYVMMRRMLIGSMSSQIYSTIAIIITAVEEALIRTTIVERDSFFLAIMGEEIPTGEERAYQKQVWAISVCQSMTAEFCAIILSRSVYLLFRAHRYVFNLGYAGEGLDSGFIVINLFLELSGEAIIDVLAVYTELKAGLPLAEYFSLIRPLSGTYTTFYFNCHLCCILVILMSFSLYPNIMFCSSLDPCSCTGGGFHLFKDFCKSGSGEDNVTTGNSSASVESLAAEFKSPFVLLGDNIMLFIIGIVCMIACLALLSMALSHFRHRNVESKLTVLSQQFKEVIDENERIKKELEMQRLSTDQEKMFAIEDLPADRACEWDEIEFKEVLGSGTFGDCFRAIFRGRTCCVKKMRATLFDEEGAKDFVREIVMLAQLDHPNIVCFEAYSTTPVPVILFGYCSGGTFLDAIDRHEFDSRKRALDVLIDVASGLLYLHSMEPRPMIHRDIKIENILLTSKENGQAQICDLGEARFASNKKMTQVGTSGYTAPEVCLGEHYGTPADVFSFAIVMNEVINNRTNYDELFEDPMMTWTSIETRMVTGLRPLIDTNLEPELVDLLEHTWKRDPLERPSIGQVKKKLEILRDMYVNEQNATVANANSEDEIRAERERHSACKTAVHKVTKFIFDKNDKDSSAAQNENPADEENSPLFLVDDKCKVVAHDSIFNSLVRNMHGQDAIVGLRDYVCAGVCQSERMVLLPIEDRKIWVAQRNAASDLKVSCTVQYTLRSLQPAGGGGAALVEDSDVEVENFHRVVAVSLFHPFSSAVQRLLRASVAQENDVKTAGAELRRNHTAKRTMEPSTTNRKRKGQAFVQRPNTITTAEVGPAQILVSRFLKAASYVRYARSAFCHPDIRLQLHGLYMQAVNGSVVGTEQKQSTGKTISALIAQRKLQAWTDQAQCSKREAMERFVSLVTDVMPEWSSFFGPTVQTTSSSGHTFSMAFELVFSPQMKLKSVEVVDGMGHTELQRRLWLESNNMATLVPVSSALPEHVAKAGPFALADCLVDASRWPTLEEQDKHFHEKMLGFAAETHDKWQVYDKNLPHKIFFRAVPWSPTKQLKASTIVKCSPLEAYDRISTPVQKQAAADQTNEGLNTAKTLFYTKGYELVYHVLDLPWPLQKKDMTYVVSRQYVQNGGADFFVMYMHSVQKPRFRMTSAFVGNIIYSGMVAEKLASTETNELSKCTFFLTVDCSVPDAFTTPKAASKLSNFVLKTIALFPNV